MSAATVRQIHWILAGALARAVRWRWITTNPIDAAQPPTEPRPNPSPPTPEQAARIVQAAWDEDHAWGALLWLVMTTGARRGEICAVRRHYVDLENAVLTLPRNLDATTSAEKDTKTHQQRRITVDADTVDILRAHLDDLDRTAGSLGVGADPNAFLFSYSPPVTHPCSRARSRTGTAGSATAAAEQPPSGPTPPGSAKQTNALHQSSTAA
jgi:integrase